MVGYRHFMGEIWEMEMEDGHEFVKKKLVPPEKPMNIGRYWKYIGINHDKP